MVHYYTEARRLQEEEERKQREEEERKAQEERERLQAIEDARFAEETAALDVWLVHQRGCYEEWKSAEWKEKQVNHNVDVNNKYQPTSHTLKISKEIPCITMFKIPHYKYIVTPKCPV